MTRRSGIILALVWIAAVVLQADPQRTPARSTSTPALRVASPETRAANEALLTQYCVTCHNDRLKTGGLVLDPQALADVAGHADVWEKVVRKVGAGLMPPQGMPQPAPDALNALTGFL